MSRIVDINERRADAERPPISTRRKERKKFCKHANVELDTEARRVYCAACGTEVPAFDALLHFARDFERYKRRYAEATEAASEADMRLRRLLHEEKKAKARAKTRAKRSATTEGAS